MNQLYRWPPNPHLKFAILESGRTGTAISAAAGLSQVTVSGIITGRIRPTANTRARLAAALNRPEHELFTDADAEVSA